ncbi:mannitol 1-phosphate dehydrogenase [Tricladium varicosporioides]|nr:mannitol 1-phosphate dehydrogenase [Hymenoscyphus varicosporioides]
MATKHPEIAILGAGIGGLALAIGLLSQNPPVPCIVYEAASKFDAIGAGIGLGPNALKSMELMSPEFARLYDEIKVGNGRAEKLHEQFEIFSATEGFGEKEGWKGGSVGHKRFTRSSAHRKALLEAMQGLIQEGTVRFGKKVVDITQSDREVSMHFADGEVIKCDVVVGCDGIKGMTRKVVLGERWPQEISAKYCDTYIYRGIAPMKEAREIIGDYALDAKWFMTKSKGWAMYPITKGEEVNIVAFIQDKNGWTGEQAAREVSREEMLSEFVGFDERLFKLLDYVKPMKWPLFHHPDTPTYINGRVCLLGDCAHASSPSQAAGAGQGLEDALILSRVLSLVKCSSQLDAALKVYDSIRRPRAQNVVRESREVGEAYFLTHPDFGHDLQKITNEANKRLPLIWWYDLEGDVKKAVVAFNTLTQNMLLRRRKR